MKLLVCGSRGWTNYEGIERVLDDVLSKEDDLTIIHGGANGADSMAAFWAKHRDVHQETYLPAYEVYARREAPLIRNEFMCCLFPDRVVAFWDGVSRGTQHTLEYAKLLGIPTETWRA